MLPDLGDGRYDIFLVNEFTGELELLVADAIANDEHLLPDVQRFVVLGLELDLMVDPNDPTAFVTGLRFSAAGTTHLSMTPITAEAIPESPAWLVIAAGAAWWKARHRRR